MLTLKEDVGMGEGGNKRRAFVKKRDAMIIFGVIVLAVGAWVLLRVGRQEGDFVQVTIGLSGEQSVQSVPLDKNGIVHIEGGVLPVQLEVNGGAVRFIGSVCPDHLCEGFGWLRRGGEWAACVPAEVNIQIYEPEKG